MKGQIFWEEVEVGTEIPSFAKVATTQMLVQWAGASGDFNPLHYQDSFAVLQGLGKPIVHGQLKRAWLIQFISDWIGEQGTLRKFTCQFRGIDYPRPMKTILEPQDGETCWCKGKVTRKYMTGEDYCIDCDMWIENDKSEITTTGSAVVVLPLRREII